VASGTLEGTIMRKRRMAKRVGIVSVFVAASWLTPAATQETQENVVYGMYSGLALLMDVRIPENPNGFGIVFIAGSGWHAPLALDAYPLKWGVDRPYLGAAGLLAQGYTLFSINHRSAPRFRYPAAVEDAQRAVRFVRYHADRFGIDPNHIGVVGASSGGHLALMLGVLDGQGEGTSPIDRESSKVQAVVALSPGTDFRTLLARGEGAVDAVASFLGVWVPRPLEADSTSEEMQMVVEASPVTHVSPDDPPILLVHGDQDPTAPFNQSEIMMERLRETGVTGYLIRMEGGGHGGAVMEGPDPPDYRKSMVEWFDRYLRNVIH
jgi:acetyl esterase/lipase